MPSGYDVRYPGVGVCCRDESGVSALRVWISEWSPGLIRIETPTIYNRTVWTLEQARQLRDVLTAALSAGGDAL